MNVGVVLLWLCTLFLLTRGVSGVWGSVVSILTRVRTLVVQLKKLGKLSTSGIETWELSQRSESVFRR